MMEEPWLAALPTKSHIPSSRIVYGDTPAAVFEQLNPSHERIALLPELAEARIHAFTALCEQCPELGELPELLGNGHFVPRYVALVCHVYRHITEHPETFGIWRVRLTTSSQMVRGNSETGKDTIFFCHCNPFENQLDLIQSLRGEISDGGVEFPADAIARVVASTPINQRLTYEQYIKAKGGNFWGSDFLNHPIFSTAFGDERLFEQYIYALQVLSHFSIYHNCIHSGWRPGEMKSGFGRAISLGLVGEAFYPPNNSTIGHAALVLPLENY